MFSPATLEATAARQAAGLLAELNLEPKRHAVGQHDVPHTHGRIAPRPRRGDETACPQQHRLEVIESNVESDVES